MVKVEFTGSVEEVKKETTEGKNIAFGRRMDTPGYDNFINYSCSIIQNHQEILIENLLPRPYPRFGYRKIITQNKTHYLMFFSKKEIPCTEYDERNLFLSLK